MKKNMFTIMIALSLVSLTACNNDDYTEPKKDWDADANSFVSYDENGFDTYFKPEVGYVGDPMPMYDSKTGEYKIYYLQDYRPNPVGTFHPIYLVTTKDGANYDLKGEAVPTGGIDEQDAAIGTGSITLKDGKYYCYYTGEKYKPTSTQSRQVVMRALSDDGISWTKDRIFNLKGEDYGYDKNDFRDPQVFKTDDGVYHMIIATRKNGKGTIAEFTSSDMLNWNHVGDFMNMQWDRFYECPDVFKMGDYWYLIYNDQTSFMRMPQYFKGKTLDELKACTAGDAGRWPDYREGKLDGKGIYAVKTASNGTDRLAFGWCPTRAGEDTGNVPEESEWAGNLVCHKLIQHSDGTLAFGPTTTAKYTNSKDVKVVAPQGAGLDIAAGKYSMFSRLEYHNLLTFDVKLSDTNGRFSIDFARATDSNVWYSVQVNADESKANFEKWVKKTEKKGDFDVDTYENTFLLDSQFKQPSDGVYHVTVCTDQSVCIVYINDELAFTNRIYQIQKNPWAISAVKGSVKVENVVMKWY